jgi:hypothetical protein
MRGLAQPEAAKKIVDICLEEAGKTAERSE